MRLQHKSFPITEVKSLDEEQGLLEAIVSVFSIEDMGGDRVMPGAFVDSLARRRPYGCLYHDWSRPVAKTLEAKELAPGDPALPESIREYGGLYVKGQFNLDTRDGQEAYSNLKKGILDQFSIGYSIDPGGSRKAKDGTTELTRLSLFEWSPVLWGMNPQTVPLSVKNAVTGTIFCDGTTSSGTGSITLSPDGTYRFEAPQVETKAQYLGEYAAEEMTLAALRDACDSLFYRAIYGILFDYFDATARTTDEKVDAIDAAISEFHQLAVSCLRAMLTAAEGDEGEMEAQYKAVFAVPARETGRLNEQLDAALAATKSVMDRYERYAEKRAEDDRFPSPDRRAQLVAIHGAIQALIEKTAPEPELDLDLIREISTARKRRIARAAGAAYAPTS